MCSKEQGFYQTSADELNLEPEARRLYNECTTIKPEWENLGAATQSVWLEYAERSLDANEEYENS